MGKGLMAFKHCWFFEFIFFLFIAAAAPPPPPQSLKPLIKLVLEDDSLLVTL
jgi:hypothetical protein